MNRYQFKDMLGVKCGLLTPIERADNLGFRPRWKCLCECGNTIAVTGKDLRSGNTSSCGCLRKERARIASTRHGMKRTRIYRIWQDMMRRCYCAKRRSFKNYGGRGIAVCESWWTFEGFYADMKNGYRDDLTLDRQQNDGPYAKWNCRWATKAEQANNTRQNKRLSHNGESLTYSQWDVRLGRTSNSTGERARRGWPVERIINTPC